MHGHKVLKENALNFTDARVTFSQSIQVFYRTCSGRYPVGAHGLWRIRSGKNVSIRQIPNMGPKPPSMNVIVQSRNSVITQRHSLWSSCDVSKPTRTWLVAEQSLTKLADSSGIETRNGSRFHDGKYEIHNQSYQSLSMAFSSSVLLDLKCRWTKETEALGPRICRRSTVERIHCGTLYESWFANDAANNDKNIGLFCSTLLRILFEKERLINQQIIKREVIPQSRSQGLSPSRPLLFRSGRAGRWEIPRNEVGHSRELFTTFERKRQVWQIWVGSVKRLTSKVIPFPGPYQRKDTHCLEKTTWDYLETTVSDGRWSWIKRKRRTKQSRRYFSCFFNSL